MPFAIPFHRQFVSEKWLTCDIAIELIALGQLQLIERLIRMGVLTRRADGRYDMPDLFRVAARLLKKGGVAPV